MQLPNPINCVVSGTLGFVFRVSRVYGIACLSFKRVPNGWCIQVSQAASIYGKIVISLASILAMTSLIMDFGLDHEIAMQAHSTSYRLVSITALSSASSVLLSEAYTSVPRMENMIYCFSQLEKIQQELSRYGPRPSFGKITKLMVFWSLIYGHIHLIVNLSIFYKTVIDKNGNLFVEGMFMAFYSKLFMLKVLVLQLALIHTTVLASLSHLNDCLMILLQRIRKKSSNPSIFLTTETVHHNEDHCISYKILGNVIDTLAVPRDSTPESLDTAVETVHRLGHIYCNLCDIGQKVDDKHGLVLLSLIAYFFLQLVVTSYYLIIGLYGSIKEYSILLLHTLWLVYYFVDMILIVEPCHQTLKQVNRTKLLVSELMRYTPPEYLAFMSELEKFYKHLMMNDISYAPMTIFRLDRSIIIMIIGSITTYLAVVIQL